MVRYLIGQQDQPPRGPIRLRPPSPEQTYTVTFPDLKPVEAIDVILEGGRQLFSTERSRGPAEAIPQPETLSPLQLQGLNEAAATLFDGIHDGMYFLVNSPVMSDQYGRLNQFDQHSFIVQHFQSDRRFIIWVKLQKEMTILPTDEFQLAVQMLSWTLETNFRELQWDVMRAIAFELDRKGIDLDPARFVRGVEIWLKDPRAPGAIPPSTKYPLPVEIDLSVLEPTVWIRGEKVPKQPIWIRPPESGSQRERQFMLPTMPAEFLLESQPYTEPLEKEQPTSPIYPWSPPTPGLIPGNLEEEEIGRDMALAMSRLANEITAMINGFGIHGTGDPYHLWDTLPELKRIMDRALRLRMLPHDIWFLSHVLTLTVEEFGRRAGPAPAPSAAPPQEQNPLVQAAQRMDSIALTLEHYLRTQELDNAEDLELLAGNFRANASYLRALATNLDDKESLKKAWELFIITADLTRTMAVKLRKYPFLVDILFGFANGLDSLSATLFPGFSYVERKLRRQPKPGTPTATPLRSDVERERYSSILPPGPTPPIELRPMRLVSPQLVTPAQYVDEWGMLVREFTKKYAKLSGMRKRIAEVLEGFWNEFKRIQKLTSDEKFKAMDNLLRAMDVKIDEWGKTLPSPGPTPPVGSQDVEELLATAKASIDRLAIPIEIVPLMLASARPSAPPGEISRLCSNPLSRGISGCNKVAGGGGGVGRVGP